MRKTIKSIIGPILKPLHASWLKRPRRYSYKDISVTVMPTVFPPFLTISTKLLLQFLEPLDLKKKRFLELGCGCGIISILAAQKGAIVTASDINDAALESLEQNASANAVDIEIQHSDLFEKLVGRTFDVIVINPPYYPKKPESVAEHAWFCGDNFEYFKRLFSQLKDTSAAEVYMILSEDCDIGTIKSIAGSNAIYFQLIQDRKTLTERNYIFRLSWSIPAGAVQF